jgi:hypothetical protein
MLLPALLIVGAILVAGIANTLVARQKRRRPSRPAEGAQATAATTRTADPSAGYPLERPSRFGGDPRLVESLAGVLRRHGLAYGAYFTRHSIIADAGDPDGSHVNLVSAHLGPRGSTEDTIRWLEGAILPQVAVQGRDFAILDLVNPTTASLLVGSVGGSVPSDPVEHYHWARAVAVDCTTAFRSSS